MEDNKKVRKGKCRNYGECDKASSQEIFEIEEGKPFECPECHEPLTPLDGPKEKKGGNKKKPKVNPIVYVGGVAILVVIGIVVWLLLRPSSPKTVVDEIVEVVEEPKADTAKTDTPAAAVVVDSPKVVEDPKGPEVKEPKTTRQKHSLSYGTWTGGWKNGKPHGTGTLTYTQATVIDSRDPKGRVAQPKEYVIGEWDNGHLVQGRWYKNDGSKEQINIGKAG